MGGEKRKLRGKGREDVEGKRKVAVKVGLGLSCSIQTYTRSDGETTTIT